MSRVDVILEQLVHAESSRADGALVGQVGGLESHVVIARNVIKKFPLKDFAAHGTTARVLSIVGCLLHRACDEAM